MQRQRSVTPDAPCFNALIGGYASRGMWGAVTRLLRQMEEADVRPDPYTYGPLLEACRKGGHRQRARRYGRTMLLDTELPLSPFCVASLRKTLGATQLAALCDDCKVPRADVEAVLARHAADLEKARNWKEHRGERDGGGADKSKSASKPPASKSKAERTV